MRTKKVFWISIVVLIVVLVLAAGIYFGQKKGIVQAERKYSGLVNLAFPQPPAIIKSLGGKVLGIYGATINLEIFDPEDYLPHLDGTPRTKETRFASVTQNTEFMMIDYSKMNKSGVPAITEFKLSDLKTGDAITVKSDRNIRDAEKFDVTEVQIIKY